jgi:hypothetical protein
MIILQYYGLSTTTTDTQAKTLMKMRHRLQKALGDSTRFYTHTKETPVHGTGQGICASPCIWLLTSSILMDCLSELGAGLTMRDITLKHIRQWIDRFEDDTSLFTKLATQARVLNSATRYRVASIPPDCVPADYEKLQCQQLFDFPVRQQFRK